MSRSFRKSASSAKYGLKEISLRGKIHPSVLKVLLKHIMCTFWNTLASKDHVVVSAFFFHVGESLVGLTYLKKFSFGLFIVGIVSRMIH
jgi:hypothetical protein